MPLADASVSGGHARPCRWVRYFYGPQRGFSPKRVVMGYVDLDIYQIGGGVVAGASMLPIGEESSVDPLQLTPVSKSKETLLLALCAVSMASSLEEVKTAPVAGFVHISEVTIHHLCSTISAAPPYQQRQTCLSATLRGR